MALSFALNDELVAELQALDRELTAQASHVATYDPIVYNEIHRQARIGIIGATTRIENAILTDAQIEWIDTALSLDGRPTAFTANKQHIEDKFSKDRERSIEEVAGCREMLSFIYSYATEEFPLTQTTLRSLHQMLLQYYPPANYHLGRYKVVPNSVIERDPRTGSERMVLKTSDPGPLTETAVLDLLRWYNATVFNHPWPIAVASEFVFRFLACHPFQDGNGRVGRALFLLTLLQCQQQHIRNIAPLLAIDRVIEQNKTEYYAVLARTSGGYYSEDPSLYRLEYFLRFMIKMTQKASESISFYHDRIVAIRELPESTASVLTCFKEHPEMRLTNKSVCEQTDLPQRTVARSLSRLVEARLLQSYGKGAGTRYQLVF